MSGSYFFLAVDSIASKSCQRSARQLAKRKDGNVEVNEQFARIDLTHRLEKRPREGENVIAEIGRIDRIDCEELVASGYDVMVSLDGTRWTLMFSVPCNDAAEELLSPHTESIGHDDHGVKVSSLAKFVVIIDCELKTRLFADHDDNPFSYLAKLVKLIRTEVLEGDTSSLEMIGLFYGDDFDDGDEIELSKVGSKIRRNLKRPS